MAYATIQELERSLGAGMKPLDIVGHTLVRELGTILFPALKSCDGTAHMCIECGARANCSVQSRLRKGKRMSNSTHKTGKIHANFCFHCLADIAEYIGKKEVDKEIYGNAELDSSIEELLKEFSLENETRRLCKYTEHLSMMKPDGSLYYHTRVHTSMRMDEFVRPCEICSQLTPFAMDARGAFDEPNEKFVRACRQCIAEIVPEA